MIGAAEIERSHLQNQNRKQKNGMRVEVLEQQRNDFLNKPIDDGGPRKVPLTPSLDEF